VTSGQIEKGVFLQLVQWRENSFRHFVDRQINFSLVHKYHPKIIVLPITFLTEKYAEKDTKSQ
jgi:hypothetical protein